MSREVDRRPAVRGAVVPAGRDLDLAAAAEAASRGPLRQRVTIEAVDPTTGTPSVIAVEDQLATQGNYVQRALMHLQTFSGALGFEPGQAPEFLPDPNVQRTEGGGRTVHLQQLYKGIPVYGAARALRFGPDGALEASLGTTATVPEGRPVQPLVTVQEAVRAAADHVAVPQEDELQAKDSFGEPLRPASVDVSGFEPKVVAAFQEKADLPTVLEPGPFGDEIKASLIWFPLEELRLAWEVVLILGDYDEQYRAVVDAETREILFCRQLVEFVSARGSVYRVDGGRRREMTEFPLPLAEYRLPIPPELPVGFPDPWVDGGSTAGNAVFAHAADDGQALAGALAGDSVVFDPTDAAGEEQQVLNAFYFNCVMHDLFYVLGFREREGTFQRDNFGRGGLASDPVDARCYREPINMTASMAAQKVDGTSPVLKLGPVATTGRHTALDSTVVFHEFVHGVTKRLVGGPMNKHALDDPQSRGMGEGWGDYVACTMNDTDVVGAWVKDDPRGLRGFRYDADFPDTFASLGDGRYLADDPHAIGEIWCATLLQMNREIGAALALRLVFEALTRSPANPGFLHMRDAILDALDARLRAGLLSDADHSEAHDGIWRAFARFGMGPRARSNGAHLHGIIPDFTTP